MILVHGGWSKAKVKEHPAIAVYAHAADMLGSHVTKTVKDTRDRIRDIMKEIVKMRLSGTKINGSCPVCKAVLTSETGVTESKKVECNTCNTKYLVRSGVILAVR